MGEIHRFRDIDRVALNIPYVSALPNSAMNALSTLNWKLEKIIQQMNTQSRSQEVLRGRETAKFRATLSRSPCT